MVHIQDLPVELLQHILSFFVSSNADDVLSASATPITVAKSGNTKDLENDDDDDDYDDGSDEIEDLRNICLVSRRFRELAQPLLFQNLCDNDLAGDLSVTIAFTKTIYRRPELGKFVQEISIIPLSFISSGPKSLALEDIELFKSAITDLQLGDQEKTWIAAMEARDPSVFVALLANKTPNLRALHLPVGQVFIKPLIHLFRQNPSFLSNLTNLWIEGNDEMSGYNIDSFAEFLALPKLRYVTFEYGDLLDASFPSTLAPGTLAVEEIALIHCHLDAGALKKLMQVCKKLKSFIYTNYGLDPHDQRVVGPEYPPEFNAAQAAEAALLHKDTLERFQVEFALEGWEIENIEEYISTRVKVGSFRDFSVLDTIILPHAYLPPHPQFPASLEKLRVTDCNSSIREMTQKIATDCKKGLYPKLTEIKVLAMDITQPIKLPGQIVPAGKTPEQCFMALQDMFKGTKVNFQIVPYNIPDMDDYDDFDYDEEDDFDEEDGFPQFSAADLSAARGPGMPMPRQLLDLFMQRAMQDPDFAHLRPQNESDDSWETDDEGN